jgi:hypothetical protein
MSEANKLKEPVIDPEFLKILACPKCRSAVAFAAPGAEDKAEEKLDGWLECQSEECGLRYRVRDGIPEMLIDEAAPRKSKTD